MSDKFLLEKLVADFPNSDHTRRILLESYGVLEDDKYLDILAKYKPNIEDISILYHNCVDLGYDNLASSLRKRYTFKAWR